MIIRTLLAAACCMLVFTTPVFAESSDDTQQVEAALERLFPGSKADSIRPSPVAGLYEVTFDTQIYYMTPDGRYVLVGDVVDAQTRTNLTEPRRNEIRAAAIEEVGEDQMVIFGTDKAAHTITVFTDIDCGYCRKLHSQIDKYGEKSIRVRYLFFPRAGPGSSSFQKAISVWCSEDRNAALTEAKSGKNPPPKTCENPVARHYALGNRIGVRGTPAIVLEDGELVPGYVSPTRLAKLLESKVAAVH